MCDFRKESDINSVILTSCSAHTMTQIYDSCAVHSQNRASDRDKS